AAATAAWQTRIVSLAGDAKATPPTPAVARGLVQLARLSTRPMTVRLDSQLGTLHELTGHIANPFADSATPAASAERPLVDSALASFGLPTTDRPVTLVERSRMRDSDGGLSLVFDVRYAGMPVWLSELRVQLDGSGALTAVHANRLTDLQPVRDVRYGSEAAA